MILPSFISEFQASSRTDRFTHTVVRFQQLLLELVTTTPRFAGDIEYIWDIDCGSNDVELVAKAVQAFISLQAPPTATLERIGCGTRYIVHSFFPEWLPNVNYKSEQGFYAHINKIFEFLRIDFRGDIFSHS